MILPVVLKALFIVSVTIGALAPVITWIERKQSAMMQDRIGANRADIGGITALGLFHPVADVIKLLVKEDVVPAGANRWLHLLSPVLAAVPAVIAFAACSPLSTAGPIPSHKSRVARPAASPIMKAFALRTTSTLPRR